MYSLVYEHDRVVCRVDVDTVRCLSLHHKGIWHLLVLCHTCHTVNWSNWVDRVSHQSHFLRWRLGHMINHFFMLLMLRWCYRVGSSLDLKELLEFSVHDFNCFMGTIYDSFEQLPRLNNWNLGLLLLCRGQALECSVEVVLDFRVNLRHDILLFLSDDLNKFKALLTLQWLCLHILLKIKFGFIPFVISSP